MNLAELIAQLRWRPRLGDNSIMGWLTVAAYGVAAVLCFVAAARQMAGRVGGDKEGGGDDDARRRRRMWTALGGLVTLLGINKQFDLQSLLTDIGRALANRGGWYNERRTIQFWFVLAVAAVSVTAFVYVVRKTRSFFRGRIVLLVGLSLLLLFVVMRAASFHHVGAFLELRLFNYKLNWILEIGSIALVAVSAARAAWRPGRNQGGGRDGARAIGTSTRPDKRG